MVCQGYIFADWKPKRDPFGHWFRMIKTLLFVASEVLKSDLFLIPTSRVFLVLFLVGLTVVQWLSILSWGFSGSLGLFMGSGASRVGVVSNTGNLSSAVVGSTMSSSIDRNLLSCKICLFVVFSLGKEDLPEMMLLI